MYSENILFFCLGYSRNTPMVAGLKPISALGSTTSLNNSFMGYKVVNPTLKSSTLNNSSLEFASNYYINILPYSVNGCNPI